MSAGGAAAPGGLDAGEAAGSLTAGSGGSRAHGGAAAAALAAGGAPPRGPISPRAFALALGALLALGLGLRFARFGADVPLTLSTSNAELQDPGWYLAAAVDGARGRAADVPAHFDLPIYTALARATFAVAGGPSFAAVLLLPAFLGGVLIVFAGLAGRAAFGARAGLFAAGLLAVGFVPVGYGRTAVVYGPLAALLAVAAWLYAEGVRRAGSGAGASAVRAALPWLAAAVGVVVALVLGLRVHAALALPGLGLGLLLLAERRRGAVVVGLAALAIVGAAAVYAVAPDLVRMTLAKARMYLGADTSAPAVLKRMVNAPWVSGYTLRAPALFLLAWAGALACWRGAATAEERTRRAIEAALASWFVVWWLALSPFQFGEAEQPAPLRHFVPTLVPAALLAGSLIDRTLAGRRVWRSTAPWPVVLCWGAVLCYWLQASVWAWWIESAAGLPAWSQPWVKATRMLLVGVAVAGAALLLARLARGRSRLGPASGGGAAGGRGQAGAAGRDAERAARPAAGSAPDAGADLDADADLDPGPPFPPMRQVARVAAFAVLIAAVALDAFYLEGWLSEPTYTLRDGNRLARSALAPGARVVGNFAHAFGYDAPHVTAHQRPPATERMVDYWRGDLDGLPKTHIIVPDYGAGVVQRLLAERGERMPVPVALFAPRHVPEMLLRLAESASGVVVLRFPWAEAAGYAPTDFERAVERDLRAGAGTNGAPR